MLEPSVTRRASPWLPEVEQVLRAGGYEPSDVESFEISQPHSEAEPILMWAKLTMRAEHTLLKKENAPWM